MNIWEIALFALILVAALFEALLGFFVLQRSKGDAAGRWLAAFMLLHSFAFADFAIIAFWSDAQGSTELVASGHITSVNLGWILLAGSTFPLLMFALHYPTSVNRAGQWVGAALAALPALVVVVLAIAEMGGWQLTFQSSDAPGTTTTTKVSAAGPAAIVAILLMAAATMQVFRVRRRNANTALERKRLLYPLWGLGLPLVVSALSIVLALAVDIYLILTQIETPEDAQRYQTILTATLVPGFLSLALLPPFSLAYGALRYKLLDIDLTLRITVRRGVVGAAFVVVFLTGAQIAEFMIQNRVQSAFIGGLAMLPLFLLFQPMQRWGDRIAGRFLPGTQDTEKYREFRRWEIYRATFEDVSRDGVVTPFERRTLESLAKSLGLAWKTIETIETQVRRERQGAAEATGLSPPVDAP